MAIIPPQPLFDWLMGLPRGLTGQARRLALAFSAGAIAFASRAMGNPVVTWTIQGATLAMPMSHALPRILLRHPDYSANIGRVAAALHRHYPDLSVIDIGANIGDTIATVRRHCHVPMLCIDGDPAFFSLLERNARGWDDIELERAYIGAASEVISARSRSGDGSGHLAIDQGFRTEVVSLPDLLARHPRYRSSKLLKVDTDGFDTLIVKGAAGYLQDARPAVFMEYDPHYFSASDPDGFGVFRFLHETGYASALFFENTGALHAIARLGDQAALERLHAACLGRGGSYYFDVCAFHAEDDAICMELGAAELARRR